MKKIFVLFAFLVLANFSYGQEESDRELIIQTVQLYFDGMMERDRSKLDQAFLPEARLIGYRGENLTITDFETWASGTAKGTPRDTNEYKNDIVSIRVQGNTASVETELYWPGIYYYDFLTLIKVDGTWKIVHKSWWEKKL